MNLSHVVRSWNAKFDAHGDITGFEATRSESQPVAQSAAVVPTPVAQSVVMGSKQETAGTPRDTSVRRPTPTLVQEVQALTQQERLARAEEARGSLVKVWRNKATGDGKGRDFRGIVASSCMAGINELMLEWFERRGLLEIVKRQERPDAPTTVKNDHWVYYAKKLMDPVEGDLTCSGGVDVDFRTRYSGSVPVWRPAYHGTWFYGLWNLLLSGQISPSTDLQKGHEYNNLGAMVYCSPKFDTAVWYARPQNLFGDSVYHCCVLELRVDMRFVHKHKPGGGAQWTFPSSAVVIVGVWICHNCGNEKGSAHLRYWQAEDECIPVGCSQV